MTRNLSTGKKKRIYISALGAFSRDSFDRVPLDVICLDAEISKGSLFQYFDSKEKLAEFVGRVFVDSYHDYWDGYFTAEKSVRAHKRLRDYFLEIIIQWQGRATEFNYLTKQMYENHHELSGEFIKSINDIHQGAVARIIDRGIETGELRGDINSGYIVTVLLGIFEKILRAYSHRFTGRINETRLAGDIEKYIRIVFEGIAG